MSDIEDLEVSGADRRAGVDRWIAMAHYWHNQTQAAWGERDSLRAENAALREALGKVRALVEKWNGEVVTALKDPEGSATIMGSLWARQLCAEELFAALREALGDE